LPKLSTGSNAVLSVRCVGTRGLCAALAFAVASALSAPQVARADQEACIASHEQAQVMRLRGRYTAARESLLRCTQMQCPALIAKDCIALLAEVDASLPSVVFAVSEVGGADLVDVKVSGNGKLLTERLEGRAVTLDPGVYTLRFEAPGYAPAEQAVTVLEGQKQRLIRAQLTPAEGDEPAHAAGTPSTTTTQAGRVPSKQSRLTITSYVLGGSAVAVLGAGIGAGVVGWQQKQDCEESCSEKEREHGKKLYRWADAAFGVAGGLAIAATWIYVSARSKNKRERPTALENVSASVHAGGAWLGWQSSF
jgi:hypothetical protein